MLPFTVDEFFGVFRSYNESVWPAQIALLVLGIAAIGLTVRGRHDDKRWAVGILALLWLWMAIAYLLVFFRPVNRVAGIFAMVFAIQAILLAVEARRVNPARPITVPRSRASTAIAVAILGYALVGYPIVGWMVGHRYPAFPTFGVPCPTTIFTLGIVAWWSGTIPWRLLVIPVAWSILGASAAMQLGVPEDWGLPVASALTVAAIALGHRHRNAELVEPRMT